MRNRKERQKKIAAATAVILAIVSAENEEEKTVNKRKRRIWMQDWYKKRPAMSYSGLLKELEIDSPMDYKNFLRMDCCAYEELLEKVKPLIKRQNTIMRDAITPNERLSTTLHFLANGQSYSELKFGTRISKSTLSALVIDTCRAIINVLKDFIRLPKEEEEWIVEARNFEQLWDFPNCLGAIDGKHINMKKPQNSGAYYFNYKKTYSIVLMAIVNANYEFLNIEVGANGRVSDGGVFSNTNFSDLLDNGELNLPPPRFVNSFQKELPYVFVADDAFPLKENIIKPYSRTTLNEKQMNFNYRVSRARRMVENTFGILASRFRILLTTINLSPEKTTTIVLAICYLHNYLRRKSYSAYIGSTDIETATNSQEFFSSLEHGKNQHPQNVAKSTRENFMEYFHLHRI